MPALSVSKLNAYAVVLPSDLAVSKLNAYAVVTSVPLPVRAPVHVGYIT